MPEREIMFGVKADRRGGVYRTSDRERAERFAESRRGVVEILAPSLSTGVSAAQ